MLAVGGDIMRGLADGITGAAGAVVSAITGAVSGAIDSAKKALGIASPSKVFAEIGGYTGEGFAMGVDESAPEAQASMTSMVEPPAPATAGEAPSTTDNSVTRGSITVYIQGASSNVAQQLIEALEGWAGQSAGAPVPS
jgi:phage-related protein